MPLQKTASRYRKNISRFWYRPHARSGPLRNVDNYLEEYHWIQLGIFSELYPLAQSGRDRSTHWIKISTKNPRDRPNHGSWTDTSHSESNRNQSHQYCWAGGETPDRQYPCDEFQFWKTISQADWSSVRGDPRSWVTNDLGRRLQYVEQEAFLNARVNCRRTGSHVAHTREWSPDAEARPYSLSMSHSTLCRSRPHDQDVRPLSTLRRVRIHLGTVHKLLIFVISRNEIVSIPLVGKSLFPAIMSRKLLDSHKMNMKGITTGWQNR